ncbi:MAG: hypothetical protein JSS20_19865, partial [Proteobacteria bacterium]|nr:hypothetical protein [Pseudomonadota bacterium]
TAASAQEAPQLIRDRNMDVSRAHATQLPRSEADQAMYEGWPLYRTPRSQEAFNAVMATLKATEGPAPRAAAFKGCRDLICPLSLPQIDRNGWLQPGRIWISPTSYVVVALSPRQRGDSWRRRSPRSMRVFVFHEFNNSSRNTDTFDTISAHKSSVFVPLYMSKPQVDAHGRQFIMVVQVAPYDVVSIHATNYGSAGPGMEVARNINDTVEPLQNLAGILVATMIKTVAPGLRVVSHHSVEGAPMLEAYERRLEAIRGNGGQPIAIPFIPADPNRVAAATGRFAELVSRGGHSAPIALAERSFLPVRVSRVSVVPAAPLSDAMPRLVGPVRLASRPHRAEPAADEPRLVEPVRPVIRPSDGR